jgi:hypothetical protein
MNAATGFRQFSLDPSCGFLFRGAADFPDQNHRVGLWVVIEKLHRVEMRHAIDRVAADANAGRLPVATRGQLPDRLVSERPLREMTPTPPAM